MSFKPQAKAIEPSTANRRLRCVAWYCIAFTLPCLILLTAFAALGMFPFGDDTILISDMQVTYTYIYDWTREVLLGNASPFYSFSKSLGGNMYGTFAGFSLSPVNLLLYLFGSDNPVAFVTAATVLKFGLAGAACYFYLTHRFNLNHGFRIALSTCYALMFFMPSEAMNLMWLDVVYLLPFAMYGIHLVISKGKMTLLFVAVLACIIVDWYNGYMVCLFTILFYIVESVIAAPGFKAGGGKVRLGILVRPGRFSIVFTLAVVASAIILLPTALELLGGKGAYPGGLFDFVGRYRWRHFLAAFFPGLTQSYGLPQFYTGLFTLICFVWFFLNKQIPRRERIAILVVTGLFIFGSWYAPIDRIWCGLRDGNMFYCRWAFLMSALMVYAAARNLMTLKKASFRSLIVACAIVIAMACLTFYQGAFYRTLIFAMTLAAICFYTGFLLLARRFGASTVFKILGNVILVVAISFEMGVSNYLCLHLNTASLNMWNGGQESCTNSRYESYFSEGREQYSELDANDDDPANAYRFTKTYCFLSEFEPQRFYPFGNYISNEGLVYGYSQVSTYDSYYDKSVQHAMSALGYSAEYDAITTYQDPVPVSDSILGIRYIATDECPPEFVDSGMKETQDGNTVYENPYALPLGFGASDEIVSDEIPKATGPDDDRNPFTYQNEYLGHLLGSETDCFEPVEAKQIYSDDTSVTWEVTLPENTTGYGYFSAVPWLYVDLSVDGVFHQNILGIWSCGIFPIEETQGETTHTITVSCADEIPGSTSAIDTIDENIKLPLYVYALNTDTLKQATDTLKEHPLEVETFDDGHVVGTYEADEDGLVFTSIPYDKGWSAKVNGQAVTPQVAQESFLCIPVKAGENRIELSYVSPGFTMGACVTAGAVLLYVLATLGLRRRDRRKAELRESKPRETEQRESEEH